MKIPLAGGTNVQRSLSFDGADAYNLYVELDQSGKEVSALYGTPGLALSVTCGTGATRGGFTATNGRVFVVSNTGFYELTNNGTTQTLLGNLTGSATSIVSFDENGLQLMVCDGTNGYILTYATNAFVKITDPDFPSAGSVTFVGGYFIVNKNNSGSYYISDIYNGLAWQPLQFASAESSPDNLSKVIRVIGQLWGFGTKTTEVFTNTGASPFPFQKIAGGSIDMGILAPETAVPVDNSVMWVGQDNIGSGIVYKATGFTPQRISTTTEELIIQRATNPTQMRAYTYQQDGHTFYVLTGGGLEVTLVFDLSTKIWHKRAYLNSFGFFEQHLGAWGIYAFGNIMVGSRVDGSVYVMSQDYYDDAGMPLCRERTMSNLSDENKLVNYSNLTLGFETGVGTQTGQGAAPLVTLSFSNDGAHTFAGQQQKSVGTVGAYKDRVTFWRLGQARIRTFRWRITDPVKVACIGAYVNSKEP